jgi:hypothetical protein
VALAVPIAVVAGLAAPVAALACSLPVPLEGQIMGFRLDTGPGIDPIVTWRQFRDEGPFPTRSAVLSGQTWASSGPGNVPAPGAQGLPANARVASGGGGAVAVWQDGSTVHAASRSGAGAFGPPVALADELVYPFGTFWADPLVELGEGGHAIALWTRSVATAEIAGLAKLVDRRIVRAVDRAPDDTWSAPYDLGMGAAREYAMTSCGPLTSEAPAVAVDAAGNAVAAWEVWLPEPSLTATLWAARPVGGAWSAPAVLVAGHAHSVQLAIDQAGTAHAAWVEAGSLRTARRPAGGAFGSPEVVGPAQGGVRLEVGADGRPIAVWQASPTTLLATAQAADGTWSPPTDLTALGRPGPPEPPIADTPIAKAPLLEAVRLSRTTLRRSVPTVLRFRLGGASEVRVTVQRRGRGKALRGLRVAAGAGEHRIRLFASRPLPPGRYTVRVRVTADGQIPVTVAKQLLVRPA